MDGSVFWGALLAFLLTAIGMPLFREAAERSGLLDRPTQRSSHTRVVPRGGGLLILLAAAVAISLIGAEISAEALAVAGGTALVAASGLWDDRHGLSPAMRLGLQSVAAVLVVATAGGLVELPLPPPLDIATGLLGSALAVLWIVAVVNFYNFLDGIDGLAGLQGVITGVGIAAAAWSPFSAVVAAALAGGCLGFLLHNWSPARIFLGDVGSGALGFFFAASPFLASGEERSRAVLFVALSLWLFLADATFTLGRRLWRGARVHEPHREHAYQRLIIGGMSHARVASLLGAGATLLTAAALTAWWRPGPAWSWGGLALAVVAFAGELALAQRRGRTAPQEARP